MFRVIVLAGTLLCLSCAQQMSRSEVNIMATVQDAEEAVMQEDTLALFRIIDPDYTKKVLEKMPDYRSFQRRVEWWKHKYPIRWSEVQYNLAFCDSIGLGTTIGADEPDVRWELILGGGPFSQERISVMKDALGKIHSVWTLTWKHGMEISCQAKPGEGYPTEILVPDTKGFRSAKVIWPMVNVCRFRSSDSTADVWFSIWINGGELSRPTLDQDSLTVKARVFDTAGVLLRYARTSNNIQLLHGMLEVVDSAGRQSLRAMAYVPFPGIKAGKYRAHVNVLGAFANDGDTWIDFEVPDECAMSDLLLLHPAAPEDSLKGILRGDRRGLFDNPEAIFGRGDTLHLYTEAFINECEGHEVEVTCFRIPDVTVRKWEDIEVGKAIIVTDTLGQPFPKGKWSVSQQELIYSLVKPSKHRNVITLLERHYDATCDSIVIEEKLRLPQKLQDGRYLLTLTVNDPIEHRFFLSACRIFRIGPTL